MARPIRLEYPGALYHITARGDRRDDIYENDADRKSFLSLFKSVCADHNWVCHAYCLMSNHYHLLVETPDGNLSRGMRQLNGVYTQLFNRVHNRVGHVFQGRYKAIHVEKEDYLLELCRYVVLNPVRAGMVRSAREWKWSSYRATAGQVEVPAYLEVDWVLGCFGKRKGKAIEAYKEFVARGKGQAAPWDELRGQVYLGSEEFVTELMNSLDSRKDLSEIPMAQKRPSPQALSWYESAAQTRNQAIYKAWCSGGYTQREIGEHFGLGYSRISIIIKAEKRCSG